MRNNFSKIALAAFAVNSALSMAFASIPANCMEEITTLSKSRGFDMQKFTKTLSGAVPKAKQMAKAPGKPEDNAQTDIGITFGCITAFPESPFEIALLLKDITQKAASSAVATVPAQLQYAYVQPQYVPPQPQYVQPQYVQPQAQQQYAPPQEQPQYIQPQVQYVYLPQPCPQCPQCPQYSPNQSRKYKVQRLIEYGIEKNKYEIQMESAYLSPDEIEDLYERNKKNAAVSALLGATIGLGIGSYAQGNIAMGVTQTLLDALSYLLIANHFIIKLGVTLISISRITGLIAPFVYTNNYNETLRTALRHNSYSYSIDPLIVPKDGGAPAVGLAFNLRY